MSRDPSYKNPNPVVVAGGRAPATSRQVAERFLCEECEQRFPTGAHATEYLYFAASMFWRASAWAWREDRPRERPVRPASRGCAAFEQRQRSTPYPHGCAVFCATVPERAASNPRLGQAHWRFSASGANVVLDATCKPDCADSVKGRPR